MITLKQFLEEKYVIRLRNKEEVGILSRIWDKIPENLYGFDIHDFIEVTNNYENYKGFTWNPGDYISKQYKDLIPIYLEDLVEVNIEHLYPIY